MRPSRIFLPLTALFLALLGQVTSLVHLGVVRHVVCADHGELVDVVGPAHKDASLPGLHTHDAIDDDDDHCVVAFRGVVVPNVSVSVVAVDPVVVDALDVASVGGAAVSFSSLTVLDRAPKTSPPLT